MQLCFKVHNAVWVLAVVLGFTGCRNDGAGPVMGNQQAPDQVSPGNGAGNSASGASGGSAAAPQANAGHIAGSTAGGSGTAGATAAGTRNQPSQPPPRGRPAPTY